MYHQASIRIPPVVCVPPFEKHCHKELLEYWGGI